MIGRDMRTLLRPRMLGLHLFAVAAIVAMVLLGLWQLGAYGDRQAVSAEERSAADPVPIDDVLGPDDAFTADADAKRVTVTGTFSQPQLKVAGDDDPTPWLVAPLETATGSAVLVVRGRAETLAALPRGEVTVTGSLLPSQARADDADPDDDVIPSLTTARLVSQVDADLYSGFVVLTEQDPPDTDSGLEVVSPPGVEPSFTAGLRNLMYALQWWVFAVFAGFMWWRIGRDLARDTAQVA